MTSAPVTVQDLLFIKGNSLVSNCGKNLVHSKPGIAGLVGLGKVAEVGSNVKHVKISDNIIVSQTGAWTSKGESHRSALMKLYMFIFKYMSMYRKYVQICSDQMCFFK